MTRPGALSALADLKSSFVEGLTPSARQAILSAATPRRFHSKTVMVEQARLGNHVFLLIFGRARHFFITERGQKIFLNWLVPGDLFGAYAGLVTPIPSLFAAEAVKNCCTLAWDRPTIRKLIAQYPRILDNGLIIATCYLTWFLAAHEALSCHGARQRLGQVLITLAKGIGQKVPHGFQLDVTNEELAYSTNITLFTVSRLMSQWQREGVLRKDRGKILLLSPERLIRRAA
ncbi:MAG TPA: Crp/Fnr family transcriptional regulator [Candidatus Acidoferrales bacterium]|jgi:CRP-like cAMP-binding protein